MAKGRRKTHPTIAVQLTLRQWLTLNAPNGPIERLANAPIDHSRRADAIDAAQRILRISAEIAAARETSGLEPITAKSARENGTQETGPQGEKWVFTDRAKYGAHVAVVNQILDAPTVLHIPPLYPGDIDPTEPTDATEGKPVAPILAPTHPLVVAERANLDALVQYPPDPPEPGQNERPPVDAFEATSGRGVDG